MNYIFYNQELDTTSNAPIIDFASKSIHRDAIVAKDSEFNVPLGYKVATEQRSSDTKLVAVEPTANSVREFKTAGQLIKKQKDSVYYRQWLLAVALIDPPFNFAARCHAFVNHLRLKSGAWWLSRKNLLRTPTNLDRNNLTKSSRNLTSGYLITKAINPWVARRIIQFSIVV